MSKFTLFPFAAATLLVLAAGAGPARAQAPDGLIIRSFVSAGGNDAHGCTRPAPCRTLSAALAKTAAGGTISIIDAGGYGTVTIDKAINIINDGAGTASILVPQGQTGVFVRRRAPGDIGVVKAALRGVRVFNNLEMGIQVLGGASRHPIDVAISDSLVTQNGQGIVANTSTTQAPVKVMVTGSTVAHSFFTGLQASASPPDPDQPDIKSIAEIWIGQSTVFGNTTGVEATGGALLRSFGDNYIAGNQNDGTFTATVPRR